MDILRIHRLFRFVLKPFMRLQVRFAYNAKLYAPCGEGAPERGIL